MPVSVLPIIDTSYSMTAFGYVAATVIDSKAFIRCTYPGDRFAVGSYDVNGSITYPPNGTALVTVDPDLKQTRMACSAIDALQFLGDCTNIGGGIVSARKLMDPAPSPKALVLLSDGYQNCGTQPLTVLPPYRIFTCAMGPYSDQALMQQIAIKTGGTYYFAPTVFQMMTIFNQIRGLAASLGVVVDELQTLAPQGKSNVPVPINAAGQVQLLAVWSDPNVAYTDGTPGQNQINVVFRDPAGNAHAPQLTDNGFAILNATDAAAGQWSIQTTYGTAAQPMSLTTGAFENGDALLSVESGGTHKAGGTAEVAIRVAGADRATAAATLVQPTTTLHHAIKKHQSELRAVHLQHSADIHQQGEVERLALLRQKMLLKTDILASKSQTLALHDGGNGSYVAKVPLPVAGSYNITAVAKGTRGGKPFQRCVIHTILAE